MTEHIEDYLNISEPVGYDNSVINIEYISQDPVYGTNLNNAIPTVITINPTSDWLLPSESYLYIEGRLLKSDGSRVQPVAQRLWPNVALLNNFFPYMYQTLRYLVNDVEIEAFNYPGQCTTIKHLATLTNKYNGLDSGWCLDTYDGQAGHADIIYTHMKTYEVADFTSAGATPTAAEYDVFCRQVFDDFNNANPTKKVTPYDAGYIESFISNPPTRAEILTVMNLMLDRFRDFLRSPRIPTTGTEPTDVTKVVIVPYFNTQLTNAVNTSLSHLTNDLDNFNKGFIKRKEFLFDTILNVMADSEAGDFSFRIPLSYLFNFCEDYRKVMFNCKHEIQLNRQTNYMPVLKDKLVGNDTFKIQIDNMRWYMPKITPNLSMQSFMLKQIEDGIEVDLAFMNKKVDYFSLPNLNIFTAQINYSTGIEKPRYIVAGFQTIDTAKPKASDTQSINYALFNGTNLDGANNLMVDVNYVNVKINGTPYQLMDYNNNFNQNRIARWYNEYKKFKKSYRGDFNEDDCISFYEFRNLYRLYVFDISKQAEQLMSTGVANVSLEFNFNQPSTPPPATMKTELYIVSFYDRAWKLKSDGTRQYIVK